MPAPELPASSYGAEREDARQSRKSKSLCGDQGVHTAELPASGHHPGLLEHGNSACLHKFMNSLELMPGWIPTSF